MKFTAVQMIGTQRSGSNLLRLMLNQLPEVSAPHPPHILERFMPLLALYGDLSIENNFRNLAADVCRLVAYNPVPWQCTERNAGAVLKECNDYTLLEIVRVIYEQNAKSEGANIWLCKSLSNIHFAGELEASLQPLYIYLYRDGRDVACSFKKAIVGEKHIYHIARQWHDEQQKCLALQQYLGNERIHTVCYEELITNPEKELRAVCNFIGAAYHSDCLQYPYSEEAKRTAASGAMWQNVQQTILSDNYNKYNKQLSVDEIGLFEKVAGNSLRSLGYGLAFPLVEHESCLQDEIENYIQINKQLKAEATVLQTLEDAEKRMLQDSFLKVLRNQLSNLTFRKPFFLTNVPV